MKIYQLEITNDCNLQCNYCPRQKMIRRIGIVNTGTIIDSIIKNKGKILRLHHYGESLLDNKLEEKIMLIKKLNPDLKLILNTNGTLLTKERAESIFDSGLDYLIISYHMPLSIKYIKQINNKYYSKIEITHMDDVDLSEYKELGIKVTKKRMRDLGQLKKEKILTTPPEERCSFLKNNEVVVLWDGRIVPCCECYDDTYVIGDVSGSKVVNKPFELCKTCLGYGNDTKETERY